VKDCGRGGVLDRTYTHYIRRTGSFLYFCAKNFCGVKFLFALFYAVTLICLTVCLYVCMCAIMLLPGLGMVRCVCVIIILCAMTIVWLVSECVRE
jgi:hypothetical protein